MGTSVAGRKGGLARVRLHGNPGTAEGRRLGGLNSLSTHKKKITGFKLLRSIPSPPYSKKLAELLGILAGDGHIDDYQVSVSTNSITDLEHASYVKGLFESIFSIPAPISFRSDCNACVVVVSSKTVGNILVKKGMVRGHKIKAGLAMPDWIRSNSTYKKAFLRGLFDTDGCVYVDKHIIKGHVYKNLGIAFTNHSQRLLEDFKVSLESMSLHPTQKTKYTVFLRRENEIERYFELVGSSNPKHLNKISRYFAEKRRGG